MALPIPPIPCIHPYTWHLTPHLQCLARPKNPDPFMLKSPGPPRSPPVRVERGCPLRPCFRVRRTSLHLSCPPMPKLQPNLCSSRPSGPAVLIRGRQRPLLLPSGQAAAASAAAPLGEGAQIPVAGRQTPVKKFQCLNTRLEQLH